MSYLFPTGRTTSPNFMAVEIKPKERQSVAEYHRDTSGERNKQIFDWLEAHNAREIACTEAPEGVLRWYLVDGRLVIVQFFGPPHGGWEVYVPVIISNKVGETIQALERYLSVKTAW
jgi:hypothetical protein